ncbi:MAG TPA: hypothetical protein VHT25_07680 [Solirubrobacteraceae bacterium]|nr:hypothetical protein [Solirubrobacteraceae bacterium]
MRAIHAATRWRHVRIATLRETRSSHAEERASPGEVIKGMSIQW